MGRDELDTALVVQPLGGFKIKIGQRDPSGSLLPKNPEGLPEDSVVLRFVPVTVTIHEDCRGGLFVNGRLGRRRRWTRLRSFLSQPLDFVRQPFDLVGESIVLLGWRRRSLLSRLGV